MRLRYIDFTARYITADNEFECAFNDNSYFVSFYITKRIRQFRIETDGTYNGIDINLGKEEEWCKHSLNSVCVNIHYTEEDRQRYLQMTKLEDRYEHYLSLLERGYRIAATLKPIPVDILLSIHDEFRANGYRNERLFKKARLKDYGIKIILNHVLTTHEYQLVLYVTDLKGNPIASGCIYRELPDFIVFVYNVKHLVIDGDKMIVTDFINKEMVTCNLHDLADGKICPQYSDEAREFMPNEKNMHKFERLKW
jgi:hypothetical protein